MKKYLANIRRLKSEFGIKSIFDALLGAAVFSSLVLIPIYITLIQLLIVFMYKVKTFTILLIVATLFFNVLYHHLVKKALLAKMEDTSELVNCIFNPLMIIMNLILFAIGLVILFVMIPIWLV
jgi:hypothetical protein